MIRMYRVIQWTRSGGIWMDSYIITTRGIEELRKKWVDEVPNYIGKAEITEVTSLEGITEESPSERYMVIW